MTVRNYNANQTMHGRPRIGLAAICLLAVVSIAAGPATQATRPIDRLIADLRSNEPKPGIRVVLDAQGQIWRVMLSSHWVTRENVRLMAELPQLTQLEIHCAFPGDLDQGMLDDIAAIKSLKSLTFYGSRNRWPVVAWSLKLQQLPQLETLSIVYVSMDADAITQLGKLASVQRLTLAFTDTVDDKTLLSLRPMLSQLESLDLRGTKVTDTSLQVLSDAVHLKRLDVSHTSVTAAGIARAHLSPRTIVIGG